MRTIFRYGSLGFLLGAACNQIVSLLMSYALRLGYYAPCLTTLDEIFGGELNAAAAQTLGLALLFAGIGVCVGIHRRAETADGGLGCG
ncbi:MAG: hypothetical protein Q4G52_05500 [Clostridia bacterium]|nr:hypothetical protein [Clostridia bacterium]